MFWGQRCGQTFGKFEIQTRKKKYPEKLINSKFSEARKRTRKSLIHQNRHEKSNDEKLRLIFTHNQGNPPLHKWFREAKECLVKDDRAKKLGDNMQICFRQPRNMKSIVTHQGKPHPKVDDPGCSKCGKCKVSCPVILEGSRFTSTNTGKSSPIRKNWIVTAVMLYILLPAKSARGSMWGKGLPPLKGATVIISRR